MIKTTLLFPGAAAPRQLLRNNNHLISNCALTVSPGRSAYQRNSSHRIDNYAQTVSPACAACQPTRRSTRRGPKLPNNNLLNYADSQRSPSHLHTIHKKLLTHLNFTQQSIQTRARHTSCLRESTENGRHPVVPRCGSCPYSCPWPCLCRCPFELQPSPA